MSDEKKIPAEKKEVEKTENKKISDEKVEKKDDEKKVENKKISRARGARRPRKERAEKEFEESIVKVRRVTRVTKGGRQMRLDISVIIGDGKGRVGFGMGKSTEVIGGIRKAVAAAKKKLINFPIKNGTIAHPVVGKFKASTVLLFPAPEGRGLIAGGAVRKILELAGVKNVLSKVHGSRNKINVAKAVLAGILELKK